MQRILNRFYLWGVTRKKNTGFVKYLTCASRGILSAPAEYFTFYTLRRWCLGYTHDVESVQLHDHQVAFNNNKEEYYEQTCMVQIRSWSVVFHSC
jgi:hypothetical protein